MTQPKETGAKKGKFGRKEIIVPETLPSARGLAGFLNVDEKTIRNAIARGDMVVNEDGSLPFQKNVMAYIARLQEEAKGYPAETAKLRHAQAEIDLQNSKIDQEKKKEGLLPREAYESLWIDKIVQIRQAIEGAEYLTAKQKEKLIAAIKKTKLAKLEKGE